MNQASNKSIILLNAFLALFESFFGILDKIAAEIMHLDFALLFVKLLIMAISTIASLALRDLYAYLKNRYVRKR